MGHGIAQVHAAIGKAVRLYEPDLARAVAGKERVADNLARSVAKGRISEADRDATLARIEPTDRLDAVADADLAIEAVFEDLEVKSGLWAELDARAPAGAIFATNTSSISIDRLAEAVAARAPAGVRGDAFLQPGPGDAADRARPGPGHRARRPMPRSARWRSSSASRSSSAPIGRGSSSTGS